MILGRSIRQYSDSEGDHVAFTDLQIDLPRLTETRLLIQSNSGGGKSYAVRRLLEQTAPHIQQLVIDPDGEFSTLRERFDYIIAAPHGGDAVANPKTAALLARRLLETGVSAILDIYDLKAHERQAFVKRFLDALVNAPRALWHPVLVVIDEAHVYCPQNGSAEAAGSVIDLCTRGRKRGFCPVLATQRLSKLHKDAAAETLNKLVGRTSLDVDVKRAADELGLTAREAMAQLRGLKPGQFFAYGPALCNEVLLVEIGEVKTTHPKAGNRLLQAPPAPSARIRASLAKLADLQVEAEQEVKDNEALRAEVADLNRKLTKASKGLPQVDEAAIQRRIDEAVQVERRRLLNSGLQWSDKDKAKMHVQALGQLLGFEVVLNPAVPKGAVLANNKSAPMGVLTHDRQNAAAFIEKRIKPAPSGDDSLKAGAVRILGELVARLPAGYTKAQVGALTGFTPSGGTFTAYMGALRRGGYVDIRDNLIYATEAGAERVGGDVPPTPTSHEEAMALWRKALKAGAFRMLEAVVRAGPNGITRGGLAVEVDMEKSGGTFGAYLGILRRNGLITESNGAAVANDILFPGS